MRKVLVPVDGSDNALRALEFAIAQLVPVPGATIHVLTVQPPVRVYGEIEVYAGHERMQELASEHGRAILEDAAERLTSTKISHKCELLEGDPATTIASRAEELGCDSIVMGTRGRGRIANLLLGSIATKVVHLATVPVTLVK